MVCMSQPVSKLHVSIIKTLLYPPPPHIRFAITRLCHAMYSIKLVEFVWDNLKSVCESPSSISTNLTTVGLNGIDICYRNHIKIIITSQWQYQHHIKATDLVAHMNIPEHPFYHALMWQTAWWLHQRKCKMPQLIKTQIIVYNVDHAVLLPIHLVNLHGILECPK